MLALPISKRALPKAAIALQEAATSLLDECPKHQRTITLNGLNFKVKNTFIDSESIDFEKDQTNQRKQRRVQTCSGKFLSFSPVEKTDLSFGALSPLIPRANTHAGVFTPDDYEESVSLTSSCGFPITVKNTFIEINLSEMGCDVELNHHTGACTCKASFEKCSHGFSKADDVNAIANGSDVSGVNGFKDTPFDDSPFGDAPRRSFFLPGGFISPVDCSMSAMMQVTRPTVSLCSALTIPVGASACSDKNATCCHWANKGFCKLGQTCKFAHPAQKQGVCSTQSKKKHLSAAPWVPDFQTRCIDLESAVPPRPCEKKSDKVCCHWKNKGWCKYQEACKFQHPVHKQGVGASKRV